jgi:hypothetical protein
MELRLSVKLALSKYIDDLKTNIDCLDHERIKSQGFECIYYMNKIDYIDSHLFIIRGYSFNKYVLSN